ncbi:FecR family protein [Pedobacter sp. ok626]|uniref:FecR family protein n=1 Tax=Pedobacter sp. ok626 TaxID=1761882 RepID=UPI00088EFC0F|nr:FecR family protein [Pedobacter sp. ok626]SDJ21871.1 FecR family protein [Pedobacter sp. ok626]
MNKEEYLLLYEKVFSGNCTLEERQQLLNYLDDFELQDLPWDADQMGDKQQAHDRLQEQLQLQIAVVPTRKISIGLFKWMAAAVALFGISVAVYLVNQRPTKPLAIVKNRPKLLKNDALPGGDKAILTLANGSQIVLDSAHTGQLAQQGGTIIGKTANGQLVYDATKSTGDSHSTTASLNTITTPRGGQYTVVLPDGTKVWLNAASSLRFPASFTGKERNVELSGEGYFEVAKNAAKPFKVKVNKVEVEVLGTHFNIMAYKDEPKIETILLEGAVKIKNGAAEALLKPGQEALAGQTDTYLKVQQANVEEAMAWKNGYFLFNAENIRSIMRKISRWYDVDIVYVGNVENKDFDGSVSRFKNVSEVLKMLELTDAIHFKVEEGRIIVMP